jgi:hypothetical protein
MDESHQHQHPSDDSASIIDSLGRVEFGHRRPPQSHNDSPRSQITVEAAGSGASDQHETIVK